jgi:hypothetical protein
MIRLTLSLILLLAVSAASYAFDQTPFVVEKTFSKKQIHRVERQVRRQYGVKVRITVHNRNEQKEITNLSFVRYQKNGQRGGGCSSDKFGLLIITEKGCKIADAGHEAQLATN